MGLITTIRAQLNSRLADLDSTVLENLITAASGLIEQYCGRTFITTTHTEKLPGTGYDWIAVGSVPITAITSVAVDDGNGNVTTITDLTYQSNVIYIDHSADPELSVFPRRRVKSEIYAAHNDLVPNCTVIYTAGYAAADVPGEIQYACELICVELNAASTANRVLESETIGEYSYKYNTSQNALSPVVKQLLAPYRYYTFF